MAFNGLSQRLKMRETLNLLQYSLFTSIFCLFLDLSTAEYLLIVLVAALVLIVEILNTAIEALVDLVCDDEYNKYAKIAKDCAAAAVLLSSIAALVVGYFLIFKRIINTGFKPLVTVDFKTFATVFIALFLTQTISAIIKILTKAESIMKGGMPSMHSASAFSMATSIMFLSDKLLVAILAYILAFFIAQSRVEGKIHTFAEVFLGAFIGTVVSSLVFHFAV